MQFHDHTERKVKPMYEILWIQHPRPLEWDTKFLNQFPE